MPSPLSLSERGRPEGGILKCGARHRRPVCHFVLIGGTQSGRVYNRDSKTEGTVGAQASPVPS
jgi:hypothetical protein